MVYTHLAAWLLGAAIASTAAWSLQDWRLGGQISAMQAQHATELAKAKAEALATERANTTKYQGALNEARTREAAARRDAGAARVESDGLRDQASAAARRIASAAPAAVAEYATAVSELFSDCSRRYQDMASKADLHGADARTLQQAWPVSNAP